MKKIIWISLLMLALLLAACRNDPADNGDAPANAAPANNEQAEAAAALQWSAEPDALILRLDRRRNEATPAELANEIPPCTLWGDGHLVWLNALEGQQQVLEARLTPDQMRDLMNFIISTGFYGWQSNYAMPGTSNPTIESITLNLADREYTVARYADWEANGYNRILEYCHQMSGNPVLFLPDGAWLSAYEVPRQENVGYWRWETDAVGFSLAEIAGSEPRWITGDLARQVWDLVIQQPGQSRALDNGKAYILAIQAPVVSRDAPPSPEQSATENTVPSPEPAATAENP